MKLSSQEEYGLRCLLQVARHDPEGSVTIPEIARIEGLSIPHVAKLMRSLRRGGFVKSVRGQAGGYKLARTSDHINIGEVLAWLGGRLFDPVFAACMPGWQSSARTRLIAPFARSGNRYSTSWIRCWVR